ncbi:fatty acid desaturase family protein [Kineococcus sp. SYSU DK001]|uniref:fatty acid desaturase family protein n=1 Tax=Kineococcus sp. SYSU DK001 TaxID=3383122 RepID=UPI003D7C8809
MSHLTVRDPAHENGCAKAPETPGVDCGERLPVPQTDAGRSPEAERLVDPGRRSEQCTFDLTGASEAAGTHRGASPSEDGTDLDGTDVDGTEQGPEGAPLTTAQERYEESTPGLDPETAEPVLTYGPPNGSRVPHRPRDRPGRGCGRPGCGHPGTVLPSGWDRRSTGAAGLTEHERWTTMSSSQDVGPRTPAQPPAAPPARAARQFTSSYTALAQRVREAGLLDRRRGYYWRRIAAAVLTLVALAALVQVVGDSWWQLLLAPLVALTLSQVAFLGHDAAHQQIFTSPRWNAVASRGLASLLAGLSHGWWTGKHNVHHAAPNQIGRDTDIDSKLLAFHPGAVEGKGRAHRWFLTHQGYWLLPLLLLEGFNLHYDSASAVLRRGALKRRRLEVLLLAARWTAYATVLLLAMSPGKAAAFVGVELALFGVLLGGAFVPNHTGMPVLARGVKQDFLRRQVSSSRNVGGGWPVDFFMGGLNRQVEHHLFPSMPRPNLPLVQPLVRRHCADLGLPYTETTFAGAYAAVITHLNGVGLAGRRERSCPLAQQFRA